MSLIIIFPQKNVKGADERTIQELEDNIISVSENMENNSYLSKYLIYEQSKNLYSPRPLRMLGGALLTSSMIFPQFTLPPPSSPTFPRISVRQPLSRHQTWTRLSIRRSPPLRIYSIPQKSQSETWSSWKEMQSITLWIHRRLQWKSMSSQDERRSETWLNLRSRQSTTSSCQKFSQNERRLSSWSS